MTDSQAINMHPNKVTYKDHVIHMAHREDTNDWQFSVKHTTTLTLSSYAARYDTALEAAKQSVDKLIGS
jgi:hypothetical protein